MIIDEPMDMPVKRPFKATKKGAGVFFDVKSVTLLPPRPSMSRHLFKMEQYFTQIELDAATFASSLATDEAMQKAQDAQQASAEIISPVVAPGTTESISEAYADKDEASKEEKIKEIEGQIKSVSTAMTMSTGTDRHTMVRDFGLMITQNKLCTIKGLNDNSEEVEDLMTISLWENNVNWKDRVAVMVRYCCFFGLTSSLDD